MLHKDMALDRLATLGNVAQYVALRPRPDGLLALSTSRVAGFDPNHRFASFEAAVAALLEASAERAVNIRSYRPQDPRSREFVYRLTRLDEVLDHLARLAREGLHLIVNETVDVNDGGVSGVVQGDVIEFAPDDTPRAVEKPGLASLPRKLGLRFLEQVYGFAIFLPGAREDRVEFSIHPRPQGWRKTHVLLWEIEAVGGERAVAVPRWPNRFSRHIGDKAFGLLMAEAYGANVPHTFVIPRRVAPFSFGMRTGAAERWIRTCPREPQPGLYTTARGWIDPFALLASEDPSDEIASVLSQDHVPAKYSGAAIAGVNGLIIEGRAGVGDTFMLGLVNPQPLPEYILNDVTSSYEALEAQLGPVRMEWVHDGDKLWVLQLHLGATTSEGEWLTQGEANSWATFQVKDGLASLRDYLKTFPTENGLILVGDFGLTSHIADVVRKWGGPARVQRE